MDERLGGERRRCQRDTQRQYGQLVESRRSRNVGSERRNGRREKLWPHHAARTGGGHPLKDPLGAGTGLELTKSVRQECRPSDAVIEP